MSAFFLGKNVCLFQESRLSFVWFVWDTSARRGANERSEKDEDSKRLKIILFFTRRYFGNRKSYRDKTKSVLNSKIPRSQWSLYWTMKIQSFLLISIRLLRSFDTNFYPTIFRVQRYTLVLEQISALKIHFKINRNYLAFSLFLETSHSRSPSKSQQANARTRVKN